MDLISVTLTFYFTVAPEIFCVSVEGTTARICWKDNTNGSAVDHYQLQFAINGQNVTSHPVGIVGKRDEVCTQVRAGKLQAGNRLKFTIKVFNKTHWSPESVERFVNITKDGGYSNFKLVYQIPRTKCLQWYVDYMYIMIFFQCNIYECCGVFLI